MKKTILIIVLFFGLNSFNRADNCSYYGKILGWDSTRCGCCEGWVIEVDGNRYLADSIPNAKEFFKSTNNQKYPISVSLDYEKKAGGCANRIVITCITAR